MANNLINNFIRTVVKALVDGLVKRRGKPAAHREPVKKHEPEPPVTRRTAAKNARAARRTTRRRG